MRLVYLCELPPQYQCSGEHVVKGVPLDVLFAKCPIKDGVLNTSVVYVIKDERKNPYAPASRVKLKVEYDGTFKLLALFPIGGFGGAVLDLGYPLWRANPIRNWGYVGGERIFLSPLKKGEYIWFEGYPYPHPLAVGGTKEEALKAWEAIAPYAGQDLNARDKFMAFRGKSVPYPRSFEEFAMEYEYDGWGQIIQAPIIDGEWE